MTMTEGTDLQRTTVCSHEVCSCTIVGAMLGTSYCSDYCSQSDDGGIETETCACGHPECDAPQ